MACAPPSDELFHMGRRARTLVVDKDNGMPSVGQILPYVLRFAASDRQWCLGGIRITLLDRLVALVSNRSLTLPSPARSITLFHAQWCACGAWLTVGEPSFQRNVSPLV